MDTARTKNGNTIVFLTHTKRVLGREGALTLRQRELSTVAVLAGLNVGPQVPLPSSLPPSLPPSLSLPPSPSLPRPPSHILSLPLHLPLPPLPMTTSPSLSFYTHTCGRAHE